MSVITDPKQINLLRLKTLRQALKLEIAGMKSKGFSAYAVIKRETGLTGTRAALLVKFEQYIEGYEKQMELDIN